MVEQITEPDGNHLSQVSETNSCLTSWSRMGIDTGLSPVKCWTGFMCFTIYNRPQLRKDHKDSAPSDLLKLAG